jgi:hypothetical protein
MRRPCSFSNQQIIDWEFYQQYSRFEFIFWILSTWLLLEQQQTQNILAKEVILIHSGLIDIWQKTHLH